MKGFIYIALSFFISAVIILLLGVFVVSTSSKTPLLVSTLSVSNDADSIIKDTQKILGLSWENNSTHLHLVNNFSKEDKSLKLYYYSLFLENYSGFSNSSIYFDYSVFNDSITLIGDNVVYLMNYLSNNSSILLNYSHAWLNFSGIASITDNCTDSGQIRVVIQAGNVFAKNISQECWVFLNYSSASINLTVSPTKILIDYSNISAVDQSFLFELGNASSLNQQGELLSTTLSSSNPGFIEPDYPASSNPQKYYGSISLFGKTYYLISMDYDSDSIYESVYVDEDQNFSNSELYNNKSKAFLNNRVFVLSVDSSGTTVMFNHVIGVMVERGKDKAVYSW